MEDHTFFGELVVGYVGVNAVLAAIAEFPVGRNSMLGDVIGAHKAGAKSQPGEAFEGYMRAFAEEVQVNGGLFLLVGVESMCSLVVDTLWFHFPVMGAGGGMPSNYAPLPIPLPVERVEGGSPTALPKQRAADKGIALAVLQEMAKHIPEGEH